MQPERDTKKKHAPLLPSEYYTDIEEGTKTRCQERNSPHFVMVICCVCQHILLCVLVCQEINLVTEAWDNNGPEITEPMAAVKPAMKPFCSSRPLNSLGWCWVWKSLSWLGRVGLGRDETTCSAEPRSRWVRSRNNTDLQIVQHQDVSVRIRSHRNKLQWSGNCAACWTRM